MAFINELVNGKMFQRFIIGVILFNAAVLGAHTSKGLDGSVIAVLDLADQVCLGIFVIEIILKLFVTRFRFFKDGWNIFDFLVVAIALVPSQAGLSILRVFRIFRVLRLVTAIHSLRRVVRGILAAIPGVASVAGLILIIFYIGSVITTNLFGEQFPEWFGDLGESMYTLFQVMTLESWSMSIVRPVMNVYPYAWMFFVPFIMVTTFTSLNLFIGIIVSAMASIKDEEDLEKKGGESAQSEVNLEAIRRDINEIKTAIKNLNR